MTAAEARALLGDEAYAAAVRIGEEAPPFSEETLAALAILLRRDPAPTQTAAA